jgi:hypothetical protein
MDAGSSVAGPTTTRAAFLSAAAGMSIVPVVGRGRDMDGLRVVAEERHGDGRTSLFGFQSFQLNGYSIAFSF